MTKRQFDQAVDLARSNADLSGASTGILAGCALPGFQPVTITLEAAAQFIRWHCICLDGSVDGEALNDMRHISRRKWLVCG